MMDIKDEKLFTNTINSISEEFSNNKNTKRLEIRNQQFDLLSGLEIINKATTILKEEPAVLQINTKENEFDFVIVGDIHGSLDSLIRIFNEKGYPPNTRYLFLGDYVDRGRNGCEVLILLYSLKCLYPNDIYLIRGNHEFKNITDFYGFKSECLKRIRTIFKNDIAYTGYSFYKAIIETFPLLPICAILDDSIFCVHGGITSLIQNRQDLLKLNKVGEYYTENDMAQAEMLWNDPNMFVEMYGISNRGRGSIFGKKAVDSFLSNMNFKLVIRGHQKVSEGYDWPFGQKGGVLTVFSAIDYCKTANNGGIAIILKENDIESHQLVNIHQFDKISNYRLTQNHRYSFPLDVVEMLF